MQCNEGSRHRLCKEVRTDSQAIVSIRAQDQFDEGLDPDRCPARLRRVSPPLRPQESQGGSNVQSMWYDGHERTMEPGVTKSAKKADLCRYQKLVPWILHRLVPLPYTLTFHPFSIVYMAFLSLPNAQSCCSDLTLIFAMPALVDA